MEYHHRGLKRISAPAVTVVTPQQVRDHLKIPGSAESDEIELYIEASTEFIEKNYGLALITQTLRLTLDAWPGGREMWFDGVREMPLSELQTHGSRELALPSFPLQSVSSITCDSNAVSVSTVFSVDTYQNPGRIALKRGQVWPVLVNAVIGGVVIDFIAGFGDAPADVPSDIRLAVLRMASHLFSHRGDGCKPADAFNDSGARGLMNNYKKARF